MLIDPFNFGALLPHFRPCDQDTFESSHIQKKCCCVVLCHDVLCKKGKLTTRIKWEEVS